MDAFYASVEIRDNPELADKPIAIGGKDDQRSVLSTCNYIARSFGVRSAMPNSVARRKCPHLLIVPGRMEVYQEISQHLREIFSRYTDKIEPLSLDEAYLDVSECRLFSGSATLIAQDIRRVIEQELNLTASAGIAPIKYLAKVASDLNKPNGQFVIAPDQVQDFIDDMSLSKIPGVGKVTFERLNVLGFHTGADIRGSDERTVSQHFGKLGHALWQKCHGIDNRPIESSRVRKSVGVERTFSRDLTDKELLRNYMIEQLIPQLKRRAEKYLVNRHITKLGVKVKFNDFHQTTKEFKYAGFDDGIFCTLLTEAVIRGNGKPIRLLGVHVGLDDESESTQQQIEIDLN